MLKMLHNLERTRTVVRNSISRDSTILAEKCQLALNKNDFLIIKGKMDKLIKDWTGYIKIGKQSIKRL